MTKINKSIIILCLLLITPVLVCGCVSTNQTADELPSGSYVVLEEMDNTTCLIYEGTYGLPQLAQPVFYVNYDFSREHGFSNAVINDSLKVVYVDYELHVARPRSYGGAAISGIYSLPEMGVLYDANLTILDVARNGTIHFNYNNQSVYLKTGDSWHAPVWYWTENDSGHSLGGEPWSYKANCDKAVVFKNIGMFNKADATAT
jgi:hypothetical protein